jgi:hypothetical protein
MYLRNRTLFSFINRASHLEYLPGLRLPACFWLRVRVGVASSSFRAFLNENDFSPRRGSVTACFLGLGIRIPAGAWMYVVNVVCRTGRSLCDGPITRPESSYRVSLGVIKYNNKPLNLQWAGIRSQPKKERKKERTKEMKFHKGMKMFTKKTCCTCKIALLNTWNVSCIR